VGSNMMYCFITRSSGFGGTEIHTIGLIDFLVSSGAKVVVLCLKCDPYSERIKSDSVKIIKCEEQTVGMKVFLGLKSLFKGQPNKLIVLPKGRAELFSIKELTLLWLLTKSLIYIEHSEAEDMPILKSKLYLRGILKGVGVWWYREKTRRWLIGSFAKKVVAVSDPVKQKLQNHYFWKNQKITVVRNGVNFAKFYRDSSLGYKFRKQNNIREDTFVFGMVTRFDRLKAVDVAIRAFYSFINQSINKNFKLVLVGEGPEEAALRTLVSDLELMEYVIFVGFVKKPQSAFSGIDCVVFSSIKEGLPLSLLEAMACKCVPIVTDVGGMAAVVLKQELIAKHSDHTGLTECMNYVVQLTSKEFDDACKLFRMKVEQEYNDIDSYSDIAKTIGD